MRLEEIHIRDPFVLKEENIFYLFGSTDKDIWQDALGVGFNVYKSVNLIDWEGPFEAFRPEEGFWGKYNFWAPEVYSYEGGYYMFATFRGENTLRGTSILRAETPLGPYTPWSDGKVTPEEWVCLDGTFYVDRQGEPWLVFCHEWIQITDGTICALQLSKDLKSAIAGPIELFKSSDASWSREAYSPTNQIRGYVTDGCFFHRLSSGKLIMLWSCMGEKGYSIGYALSDNDEITGKWIPSAAPLFEEDGGHGMIFQDDFGRLLLAIHTPNDTPKERAIFIELQELIDGVRLI